MKTLQTTALLLASIFLVACGTTTPQPPAGTAATTGGKVRPYPLSTCIVTDNDVASMGGAITKVYGNQEVKFCCRPCVRAYEANPAKYQAKLGR